MKYHPTKTSDRKCVALNIINLLEERGYVKIAPKGKKGEWVYQSHMNKEGVSIRVYTTIKEEAGLMVSKINGEGCKFQLVYSLADGTQQEIGRSRMVFFVASIGGISKRLRDRLTEIESDGMNPKCCKWCKAPLYDKAGIATCLDHCWETPPIGVKKFTVSVLENKEGGLWKLIAKDVDTFRRQHKASYPERRQALRLLERMKEAGACNRKHVENSRMWKDPLYK